MDRPSQDRYPEGDRRNTVARYGEGDRVTVLGFGDGVVVGHDSVDVLGMQTLTYVIVLDQGGRTLRQVFEKNIRPATITQGVLEPAAEPGWGEDGYQRSDLDGGTPEPRDLNYYALRVHKANKKWWQDPATGDIIERNVGEMLMLAVSELAEALEAHRKDLMDSHLPHRKGFEVEIVDTLIRLFDLSCGLGLDLDGAFEDKMAFNAIREDHKHESRLQANGKKY